MQYTVQTKYIIFPVNTYTQMKTIRFQQDGKQVYTLDIKLDAYAPTFYAYIDVSRFMGETLEITVDQELALTFSEADELCFADLYGEPLRPQVHFTTKNGWSNDPNGLVYNDGVYHLFYQHNPADIRWGNMHWGHAISRDLIHWEEQAIALFPDQRGTMFSGSAVPDVANALGKNADGQTAIALFYTTTDPFCQNLSYSTDGLKTLVHHAGNPVVPHIVGSNRDPKVVYCPEWQCYLMALYLAEADYALLRSTDLVNWTQFQQITLPGDNECPDLFCLQNDAGERRWVLMGAHNQYLVGRLEQGRFVSNQPVLKNHYGTCAYAGQTFSNLPHGRVVRMEWGRWEAPAERFCSQMNIPLELSLCTIDGIDYLQANPVKELETLYADTHLVECLHLTSEEPFRVHLADAPVYVHLSGKYPGGKTLEITVFGISVTLDFSRNEVHLCAGSAPISATGDRFDIKLLVDRCSVELFSDNGRQYITGIEERTMMDRNLPHLLLRSCRNMEIDRLEWHTLDSIWR